MHQRVPHHNDPVDPSGVDPRSRDQSLEGQVHGFEREAVEPLQVIGALQGEGHPGDDVIAVGFLRVLDGCHRQGATIGEIDQVANDLGCAYVQGGPVEHPGRVSRLQGDQLPVPQGQGDTAFERGMGEVFEEPGIGA